MSYREFLSFLLQLREHLPFVIERLQAIYTAAKEIGSVVGDIVGASFPTVGDTPLNLEMTSLSDEDIALESQVVTLYQEQSTAVSANVFDGSRLRMLFELVKIIGPLLPLLFKR